jgi:hypothetical protein
LMRRGRPDQTKRADKFAAVCFDLELWADINQIHRTSSYMSLRQGIAAASNRVQTALEVTGSRSK